MIKNNKYKTVLCRNWAQGKCIHDKSKCIFAHGKDDLIKQDCVNGINCYNENCWFKHPSGWIPYNNKKDCIFCEKGFCNKENNKYKHINNDIYNNIDEFKNVKNNEKINIIKEIDFNDDDFPILNNNIKYKHDPKENKISHDVPILINNEIKPKDENDIKSIKEELYREYKFLSKLNPNESWANEKIIEETNNKIKILTDKYNILKSKKEDVFDKELNLRILENNNKSGLEDTLKCINTDDYSIPNVNISFNYNEKTDNNILSIINKMEEENQKYIIRIKTILDKNEKSINDENKIYFKLQLNNIIKEINLLKLNYEDLI